MNRLTYRCFSPPAYLTAVDQVKYCVGVIERYQTELPILRTSNSNLKRKNQKKEEEVEYWKQKYRDEQEKSHQLETEITELKAEVEKLTKTTNRYKASLFDHGNFKSLEVTDKKKKGGQVGHVDTNRELYEINTNYPSTRIFSEVCPTCQTKLPRVNATSHKLLLDIVLNPQVVKLLIESERQWCGHCRTEISTRESRSLPFTEYGLNTLMMVLLLRFRCLLPYSKIAQVLKIGYGLKISKSGINSLLSQAAKYLDNKYETLKQAVRNGDIMYADETGWQVGHQNAWMWIMASDTTTVYVAAESRGQGVAQEMYGNSQAYSMHDGLASYASVIPANKNIYCWAHMLRFAFEETVLAKSKDQSLKIRDKLVEIFHLQKDPKYLGKPELLEQTITINLDQLLSLEPDDESSRKILHRLKTQRDGLIRALLVSPNGTNNLAEQELRPLALMRKTTYGSNTYTGMETTAVLASVVQSLMRTNEACFFSNLATAIQSGFVKP